MFKSSAPHRLLLGRIVPFFMAAALALPSAHAAVTPTLGAASTYAVLSSTYTNTTAGTVINGDIGFTTGPAVTPGGAHPNYGLAGPYALAGTDQNAALSALNAQACTFSFPAGAVNLSTDTSHGSVGAYTPGVYCSSGAMSIGGPLTLNGNGTYIFRTSGALTSTAGSIVSLVGASACNVFWTPAQAVTLGANTSFAGIIIAPAGITVGANTLWSGLALAFGGTVTTDSDVITAPGCSAASSSSSSTVGSSLSSSSSSSSVFSSSLPGSLSSSRSSSSLSSSSMFIFSSSFSSSSFSSSSSVSSSLRPVVAQFGPVPPPPAERQIMPITGVGISEIMLSAFGLLMAALFFVGSGILKRRL